MELYLLLLRWIHVMAGITWVGILYYFNFVQTPFFGQTGAPVALMPRALRCFHWGAAVTTLAGILFYIHHVIILGGSLFYTSSNGLMTTVGGLIGILMFFNGFGVMWPNQKVIIASAEKVRRGGEPIPDAAACGRRIGLASRTNTLFSIPMLFFMEAASHYPVVLKVDGGSLTWFWITTLVIIGAIELNALIGLQGVTKKLLFTLSGTLSAGFVLTAVLCLLFFVCF
jgi:uncharacterized membrane protein